MPRRNWGVIVNLHVHPCLYSHCPFLFGTACAIQDFSIFSIEFLVVEACLLSHLEYLEQNRIKQRVTVTSAAVETTNILFSMCNCTVDSEVSMGDFSLVLEILHLCGHVHVQWHLSLSVDCRKFGATP